LFCFLAGYATPYLVAAIGINVFYIWFGCITVGGIFAWFCIYETANLSLEEVDELYAQTTARKSKALNAQLRAQRTDMESTTRSNPVIGSASSQDDLDKKP